MKVVQRQAISHLRRVDLRAEDVLRRIMMTAAGDIPSRTSRTITDEVVTEVEITDRLKALGLRRGHPQSRDEAWTVPRTSAASSARSAGQRLLTNVDILKVVQRQAISHLRRVDLRAEDVLRRIMMTAAGDIPSRTSRTITDEVVTEVEITDRLKALGLLAQHFDLLKSKLDVHHTGTVGLLEEETLRHMSDENLAKLKAATDTVFELMGE